MKRSHRPSALDLLRTQARWRLLLQLGPLVPGLVMVAVTLVFHASESAFVRLCTDWWWNVVFAGGLLMLAVSAAQFLFPLRCPACGFGLHQLGLHPPMLVLRSTPVRYCAHCGADFHQPEPTCAPDFARGSDSRPRGV